MTQREIVSAYAELSPEEQSRTLAKLSSELTLAVRGQYSAAPQLVWSGQGSPVGMFNELQHKISDQLVALLQARSERYPDDVFVNILFDMSDYNGWANGFARVFTEILQQARHKN